MTVVLYDDVVARRLEPFALTRPAGALRAGAELISDRWQVAMDRPVVAELAAPHLVDFVEDGSPPVTRGGTLAAGTVVANARCAPALARIGDEGADAWTCDGRVAAVRLMQEVDAGVLSDGTLDLEHLTPGARRATAMRGWWIDHPWDLVRHLGAMLADDVGALAHAVARQPSDGWTTLGAGELVVEDGAEVEPFVVFDLRAGPVLVRRGARIAAFTRVAGPCVVGRRTHVLGGKVAGSSLGDDCRVHGEVSNSIFIGQCNKGHEGFLGHSVLGRWVNLGASTVTSNLKNTYGPVSAWTPDGLRDTGLQFLGTLMGDHARTAIGTRLTTGGIIGAGANVFLDGLGPKVIRPFAWGGLTPEDWDLDRFLAVAERVMARRQVRLEGRARKHLERAFVARWRG